MKKTRLLATAAIGLAAALSLTACSGGGSNNATTSASGTATSAAPAGASIRVWLVGTDTPQAARDYLKTTFETQNPGSTLAIEEQQWSGLVDKYTTSLSGSDAPDVVEIGNTQAPTFTSTGFFTDLTSKYDELGGSDLLPGFVDIGSYDGKFYAAPYYSGARVITYSSQVFTGTAPTTLDAYLQAAKDNTTDARSGLYVAGKDWRNGMTYVWAEGAEIAKFADGKWKAGFNTPEGIAGLTTYQNFFKDGISKAPTDALESTNQTTVFCEGNIAFVPGPSWTSGVLQSTKTTPPGCPDTFAKAADLHQFAVPGKTAGTYAPALAGGSNIAIPAKSTHQDLAYAALKIMLSDDYQKVLAEAGLVPAGVSQAKFMPANEFSQASANAASVAKLTPASPKWSDVEAQNILEDGFSKIAQGQDVATVAADMDSKIESILNS
ncbi:MAG: extracellular solute-binding protein [Propionibacteriaceae bacterium]|jgi:N,N'-diacetylchitobiose transport system substrate-binding protein|nr:extracellular solute-binding protein [Propionibacteriaceae bacterium]